MIDYKIINILNSGNSVYIMTHLHYATVFWLIILLVADFTNFLNSFSIDMWRLSQFLSQKLLGATTKFYGTHSRSVSFGVALSLCSQITSSISMSAECIMSHTGVKGHVIFTFTFRVMKEFSVD